MNLSTYPVIFFSCIFFCCLFLISILVSRVFMLWLISITISSLMSISVKMLFQMVFSTLWMTGSRRSVTKSSLRSIISSNNVPFIQTQKHSTQLSVPTTTVSFFSLKRQRASLTSRDSNVTLLMYFYSSFISITRPPSLQPCS